MRRSTRAWVFGLLLMSGCEPGILDTEVSDSEESALRNARCSVNPSVVATGAMYQVTAQGLSRDRVITFVIQNGPESTMLSSRSNRRGVAFATGTAGRPGSATVLVQQRSVRQNI